MEMNKCVNIAIDTVFFNMPYSGISRVWEGILSNLELSSLEVNIILLIRGKEIPRNILKSGFHKKFVSSSQLIHIPDFAYPMMQQDVDILNQFAKQYNWHYFISTYYTYCTCIPNILVLYDMIPEVNNFITNHMWMQKNLAIRNASQFICISNTTKLDLIKTYPYLETENYPIHIIYCAISLTPIASENIVDEQKLKEIQDAEDFYRNSCLHYGLKTKKYILTIATNQEAYKNQILIQNLIKKYRNALVKELDCPIPLVIIIKNVPNPNGCIIDGALLLSDISDAKLQILYKNAAIFINASLAEGFSLPVFEAFGYKVPVIACNLPVYEELCPGSITYIQNDVDDLFQKINIVLKNSATIQRRIESGYNHTSKYTLKKQIDNFQNIFNSLAKKPYLEQQHLEQQHLEQSGIAFLNIIFQSYPESNNARKKELEYCILSNLEHPYIKYIHDFATESSLYLPDSIIKHPKYKLVSKKESLQGAWLSYKTAFNYSSNIENKKSFGIYWAIINCDIMLSPLSSIQWTLIRGWLNSKYILAQSRNEFDPISNTAKMDFHFSKLMHSNTQDAWFYSTEQPLEIKNCDFKLGMLGCDNAIAERILSSGFKIINMPETFPIWHYDIARGKNSSNFLEKHKQFNSDNSNNSSNNSNNSSNSSNNSGNNSNNNSNSSNSEKPKNTHPERTGQSLVPNYDALMRINGGYNIDLITIINQLGGISNLEKYKLISEMMSTRIHIYNP